MIKKWYQKLVSKPFAATMDEWADWTAATKKNHPVLYFLFDNLPIFFSVRKRRFKDFFYHVRQKYGNGYHILKLDVKRFKSPYGKEKLSKYSWFDANQQLEAFSFQILVNFVEKEVGYEQFKENAYDCEDQASSTYHKQLLEIYHWYIDDYCNNSFSKKLRAELHKEFPDHKKLKSVEFFNKPRNDREREYQQASAIMYAKINDYNEAQDKQMTEHLITLIKMRGFMWT